MTHARREMIIGLALVLASAAWCWATIVTIPGADDATRLGSRGFPLELGILLGLLGLWVALMSLRQQSAAPENAEGDARIPLGTELWAIASTLFLIVGYAIAMEQLGFLIATVVVIVVAIVGVLGLLRPVLIAGLAVGMAGGIYLVFGKLLGVYLPHGQLIDLTF